MTDKMREEFEAAYKAACLERPIPRFDPAVFVKDHCDDYLNSLVQSAWWGWKASRSAAATCLKDKADKEWLGSRGYHSGWIGAALYLEGKQK